MGEGVFQLQEKDFLKVRQAGTLGPLLQCCKACTCTCLSLSYKIQRNYRKLKLTPCTQLRQILEQKIQRHFWRAGYKIWVLRMSPLHTILPKGLANQLATPPARNPCLNSCLASRPISIDWEGQEPWLLSQVLDQIRLHCPLSHFCFFSRCDWLQSSALLEFSWLRDSRSSYTFPTK